MRVRRTGARAGESPVWYVQATTEEEIAAIEAGTLEAGKGPEPRRWRHVLAWGFRSQVTAAEAMEELERGFQDGDGSEAAQTMRLVSAEGSSHSERDFWQ